MTHNNTAFLIDSCIFLGRVLIRPRSLIRLLLTVRVPLRVPVTLQTSSTPAAKVAFVHMGGMALKVASGLARGSVGGTTPNEHRARV